MNWKQTLFLSTTVGASIAFITGFVSYVFSLRLELALFLTIIVVGVPFCAFGLTLVFLVVYEKLGDN